MHTRNYGNARTQTHIRTYISIRMCAWMHMRACARAFPIIGSGRGARGARKSRDWFDRGRGRGKRAARAASDLTIASAASGRGAQRARGAALAARPRRTASRVACAARSSSMDRAARARQGRASVNAPLSSLSFASAASRAARSRCGRARTACTREPRLDGAAMPLPLRPQTPKYAPATLLQRKRRRSRVAARGARAWRAQSQFEICGASGGGTCTRNAGRVVA